MVSVFPMSLDQVASYLALDKTTVKRFAKRGDIKGVYDGWTRTWSFDRDDVDDFIDSCRIEPGTLTSGRPWLGGVRL